MRQPIHVGTLLIADGSEMPQLALVHTEPYSIGWSAMTDTSAERLSKDVERSGWTFFYMSEGVHATGWGLNEERVRRAMAQVIDAGERQKCNCLEVTRMEDRSFLGFPYTNISVRARHIQKSRIFNESPIPATRPSPLIEGLYDAVPWRQRPIFSVRQAVQNWENEGGAYVAANLMAIHSRFRNSG
jgi:hypothetical protein